MPLTRTRKTELVEHYQEALVESPHVFLLNYKGIRVAEVTALRDRIRESGGRYEVVRNRLARRALGETALADLEEHFEGPTAVAWSNDDPVALAKVLVDFAKDVPALQFKAGLLDGTRVSGEQVAAIATLPSREELIAKLLFLLKSPVTRLVRTLGALPQQLVIALDQIAKKKETA